MSARGIAVIIIAAVMVAATLISASATVEYLTPYYWCFQETANVSTACGGLATGRYVDGGGWSTPVAAVFDEDYGTSAQQAATSDGNLYVNYTIPPGAVKTNVTWTVKDFAGTANISIPSACVSSDGILKFQIKSQYSAAAVNWYCRNDAGAFVLQRTSAGNTLAYEEAVWWNNAPTFNLSNLTLAQVYNASVPEFSSFTLTLNVTYTDGGLWANSTANLTFDGTKYALTAASWTPTGVTFSRTFTAAAVGTYAFSWAVDVQAATWTAQHDFASTPGSMTVTPLVLTNCTSPGGNVSVRAVLVDEQNNASSVRNLTATFYYRSDASGSVTKNASFNLAGRSTYSFCQGQNVTLYSDIYFQISNNSDPLWYERNYYFRNLTLTNTTTDLLMYSVNSSAGTVVATVKDLNDRPLVGAILEVWRFYPGSGDYRRVESAYVDNNGNAVIYVYPYSVFYRFTVRYGESTYNVPQQYITTSSVRISVDTEGYYIDDYVTVQGVTASLTYTNATGTFTYFFTDPSGAATQGCLRVTQAVGAGTMNLCSQCAAGASGNVQCVVDQNTTYAQTATATVTVRGTEYVADTLTVVGTRAAGVFGKSGIVMAILIIATMALVGSFNPAASLALSILGLLAATSLGMLTLTQGSIIGIVIVLATFIIKGKT